MNIHSFCLGEQNGENKMKEAVIVSAVRTAIEKA